MNPATPAKPLRLCYGYVVRAPEGGVSLQAYPAVRAWLARVEGLPGFLPMPQAAVAA